MSAKKLTKTTVENLPVPTREQAIYRDSELLGFGIRVSPSGTRAWLVEKRIHSKLHRITLGRYPDLTPEQARMQAHRLLGQLAVGRNPLAERKRDALFNTTLGQAFDEFLLARKDLAASTLYEYKRIINGVLGDWRDQPMINITKDMVMKRHAKLGENNGHATANYALRFLRSLLNFAMAQYEDAEGNSILRVNPVIRLSQTRAWYRVGRRQTIIRAFQLKPWIQAVDQLRQDGSSPSRQQVGDYLLFLLLTGLRRREAATLKWNDIDFTDKTLRIRTTKNHEPHCLPLSTMAQEILEQRLRERVNDYVFGREGKPGYLTEPRPHLAPVIEASGVEFSLHDLRRTFITVAESLDISAYALKRLVNHKMTNDVTAGHIISDVERLRIPMQRITDYLVKTSDLKPSAQVLLFDRTGT